MSAPDSGGLEAEREPSAWVGSGVRLLAFSWLGSGVGAGWPTRSPGGYNSSTSADSHGCHIRPDLPCSHGSLASISWGIPYPASQAWGSLGARRVTYLGGTGLAPHGLSAYL